MEDIVKMMDSLELEELENIVKLCEEAINKIDGDKNE